MNNVIRIFLITTFFAIGECRSQSSFQQKANTDSTEYFRYLQNLVGTARSATQNANYSLAASLLDKGLNQTKTLKGQSREWHGFFLSQKGDLLMLTGDLTGAVEFYNSSLIIYRQFPRAPQQTEVHISLAVVQMKLQKLGQAEQTLLKADSSFHNLYPQDQSTAFHINIWNLLANVYLRLNDNNQALYCLEKVQKMYDGDEPAEYFDTAAGLIPVLISKGLRKQAMKEVEKAKRIVHRYFKGRHPDMHLILSSEAEINALEGQLDKAEKLFYRSLELALQEHAPYFVIASIYNIIATFYQSKKIDFDKAEHFRLEALQILEQDESDQQQLAMANNDLASLYMKMKAYEKVAKHLEEAQKIILKERELNFGIISERRNQIYKEGDVRVFNSTFSYTAHILKTKPAPHLQELSYNAAIYLNGLLLDDARRIRQLIHERDDALLTKFYQDWIALKEERVKVPASQMADLLLETERVEQQMIWRLNASPEKSPRQLITWKSIRDKLLAGQVAVTYIRYQTYIFHSPSTKALDQWAYAALLIKSNSVAPEFIELGTEKTLDGLIKKSLDPNQLYGPSSKSATGHRYYGDSLYQFIWAPLESYLKNTQTIFFSPDGLLHKVAFSALPYHSTSQKTASKDSLLSQRYRLRQLFNTSQIANGIKSFYWEPGSTSVVMGDIKYDQRLGSHSTKKKTETADFLTYFLKAKITPFKPLSYTKEESKEVHKLLSGSELVIGPDAGEDRIKSFSGKAPSLLHLGTHGFFLSDSIRANGKMITYDPLFRSGLAVAGVNRIWEDSALDDPQDGVLTAYEIANLDLGQTRVIVLSACQTASGDILGPEGVYGLQRAFRLAGVEKMIMSLWSVGDNPARFFMNIFYSQLTRNKEIRVAFEKAQAETRELFKDPAIWATFVLVE